MERPWYVSAYRRNVIDMHIADWDERFLSQFDPTRYVQMLELCGAQSAVVYAHSHVGHCYYPTQVGHMHAGLKGRNILGEVIDLCHARNIAVVVYYSLIYDDYAYRHHPDWRIRLPNGEGAAEHSRYGVCCPNSPYREYARAHTQEICRAFDFEGMRLDMTFWPTVCYCTHCRARFAAEVGGELPTIINWEDPRWVAFQRRRETWLNEFAAYLTAGIREIKPQATVEHQASTYPLSWRFGVTTGLVPANDFLQGDFYGDALQGSFVRKLLGNLSPHQPYGFETSSAVNLGNHTGLKSEELLRAKASACMADGGAFVFIDAIDPVGTLNPAVYERMSCVFRDITPYQPFLGGQMVQDVAIYLSTTSKFDPADNGKPVDDPHLSPFLPHVAAALGACQALITRHIPYGVITKRNLENLSRHRVIVLPNVLMMDKEEVEALRGYVRNGGRLYASGCTSLVDTDGVRHADFLLADLFGVSYSGQTEESFTYIAPAPGHKSLFPGYSAQYPLGLPVSQCIVRAGPQTEGLGTITLPYTNPADPSRYASIHSNPPGVPTENPAVTLHRFGQGLVIYSAADLESHELHYATFVALIRHLGRPFSFEARAPKAVEITLFDQPAEGRLRISLINFQKDLPNIPVKGVRVRLRLRGKQPRRLLLLPDQTEWPYQTKKDGIVFIAPPLKTVCMLALEYT